VAARARRKTLPTQQELDAELARRRLRRFARSAWHVVEPVTGIYNEAYDRFEPIPNYHADAVCDHLQAVTEGHIRRLVINIPPRCQKSLTTSVMWPAWSWIDHPHLRFIFSSYVGDLAIRDSLKTKRIIESEWYQRHFGKRWSIRRDRNNKTLFENTATGFREALSSRGGVTGKGAHILVCDDPHNVREAESDVVRQGVLDWWDEVMSTRLDDPMTGAMVLIMQRVHFEDLAAHVLERGDWEHVNLPMEYEGRCIVEVPHRCSQPKNEKGVDLAPTTLGFRDPRTTEGELLWPARMPESVVNTFKRDLGPYAYAGQMQQRPTPRKGGFFKVDSIVTYDEIPRDRDGKKYRIEAAARGWDKAATDGGGDWSAGVLVMRLEERAPQRFVIAHVVRGQWSSGAREATIRSTAEMDGDDVYVVVEQEPGSSGVDSAVATMKNLAGFDVESDKVTGSKPTRARPLAVQIENGNVCMLSGEWNRPFIDEMRRFPAGTHDDQVDAAAAAFKRVANPAIVRQDVLR
jgi:predicted phage terminase large subunit-like protein